MYHRLIPTLALAGLLLGGCATSYELTVMPRDSGKTYSGTMSGPGSGGGGPISVTIEGKTYSGTWVESVPAYTTGWVGGGVGYRGWGGWGWGGGGTVRMDTPGGGAAKALLSAPDGSGLRCDLRGSRWSGGGECRDDKGRDYDVQIRQLAQK